MRSSRLESNFKLHFFRKLPYLLDSRRAQATHGSGCRTSHNDLHILCELSTLGFRFEETLHLFSRTIRGATRRAFVISEALTNMGTGVIVSETAH